MFDALSEEDRGLLFYQFKILSKREWTKTTEMEEDDENGECPHALKLRDSLFSLYRGGISNKSLIPIAFVPLTITDCYIRTCFALTPY